MHICIHAKDVCCSATRHAQATDMNCTHTKRKCGLLLTFLLTADPPRTGDTDWKSRLVSLIHSLTHTCTL